MKKKDAGRSKKIGMEMQTLVEKTKSWNERTCTDLEEGDFSIDGDQCDMITTVQTNKIMNRSEGRRM